MPDVTWIPASEIESLPAQKLVFIYVAKQGYYSCGVAVGEAWFSDEHTVSHWLDAYYQEVIPSDAVTHYAYIVYPEPPEEA